MIEEEEDALCIETRDVWEEEGVRFDLEWAGEECARGRRAFDSFGGGVLPYVLKVEKSETGREGKRSSNFVVGHGPAPRGVLGDETSEPEFACSYSARRHLSEQ